MGPVGLVVIALVTELFYVLLYLLYCRNTKSNELLVFLVALHCIANVLCVKLDMLRIKIANGNVTIMF